MSPSKKTNKFHPVSHVPIFIGSYLGDQISEDE
jgi:hypothetical protein